MLTYNDLILFVPSLIAISLIFFGAPLVYYLFARIFLNVWHVRAIRYWCMSGVNLRNVPKYCKLNSCDKCKNWTCPNYKKNPQE